MSLILRGAHIVTPFRLEEHSTLTIDGDTITALGSDVALHRAGPGDVVIDLDGLTVVPGFLDLLVHGGGGDGFADATPEGLDRLSRYFYSHGTTGVLAGLYCQKMSEFTSAMQRIRRHIVSNPSGNILGIHLEGPFISPQFKGAMRTQYIKPPDIALWLQLQEAGGRHIKMMTIAPELPGSAELIEELHASGVVASIGHSGATYADVEKAAKLGVNHVTHLFNAMKPLHHREPGLVGACFLKPELVIELIADGVHIHPDILSLLYRLKGRDGIVLVSDAIFIAGLPDGDYVFADRAMTVRDRKAFLEDGTLAGSALSLDQAVRTMVECAGVPLTAAVQMASLNPVRTLGLEATRGLLAPGMRADIAVLDEEFSVHLTIAGGEIVHRSTRFSSFVFPPSKSYLGSH